MHSIALWNGLLHATTRPFMDDSLRIMRSYGHIWSTVTYLMLGGGR